MGRIELEKVKFPNPLRFLWNNRDTLLLAFFLAVAVWVSAVLANDPNREDLLPDNVPLQVIGMQAGLVILDQLPTNVSVKLRAPESVWQEIIANPDLVTAKVDLSGLTSGEHIMDVAISVGISPAQILEKNPGSVTIHLDKQVTTEMEVTLQTVGTVATGYQVDQTILTPRQVVLTGPESLMEKVTQVSGKLTLTGAREDITATISLQAADADGRLISGITLNPATVQAWAQITQAGGYRDVAVKVETIGQPANGYRVTNVSVEPPTITLYSSDAELVAGMPGFVSTLPLDLNEAIQDIVVRLAVELPEGVTMVGDEQSVAVKIGITAIETSISMNVPIQIVGLGVGLHADLSPDSVDIFLTGPLRVVEELAPEDVIVFVTLTDLGEGSYLVEPEVDVLQENVVWESVNPDSIEVVITLAPEGTPSPQPTPTP